MTASRSGRFGDRWGARRLRRLVASGRERYAGSSAQALRDRLRSVGVINRAMVLAATLLLCFFPFVIVTDALAGRTAVVGLVQRLGLDRQAVADVSGLFASPTATDDAVSGASSVFFVIGGIAGISALQELYQLIFELPGRGARDLPHRVAGLAVVVAGAALSAWLVPHVREVGGPVLLGVVGTVALVAFWWLLIRVLLAGRIPWRELFPSACATGLCYLGMAVVFSLTASSMITSNAAKYGAIGVVFAVMSWLIAIGVVIILGAVTGIVWRERGLSVRAALRRPGGACGGGRD
ncbi:YhjD/YihY/BrkB family envelope integrity protein [Kitasatospora sp. LaBMicrA B282]|uniref:YhjD/YihY/BrkB family envelope integrity protein n=1 Tax=Kitasatospora sp. LaBMicrA B282 TaxID=3420949 RepID=UPI003D102824